MDLDTEFGSLRAADEIATWEIGEKPVSRCILDALVARSLQDYKRAADSALLRAAALAQNFIWAMRASGDIVIAVEELAVQDGMPRRGIPRRRDYAHPSERKKLGHPTLLDGEPARMAGELAFDESEDGSLVWILNANSGRYCRNIRPTAPQVQSVALVFRDLGIDVRTDPL